MATITYEVIQKPIEERIIDAACIYWDVERSYFFEHHKGRDATYRKSIIYYLIKANTTYSYGFMAEKFGLTAHQPVIRLISGLDATKEKITQHSTDINKIQFLADKLDASFVQVNAKLINNELEILNT